MFESFFRSGFDVKFISALKHIERNDLRFIGEHKMINLSQSLVSIGFFIHP
jgi:hypothetical protein